ncbi:MAG TPA: serine hydrolase domain-containing protein [Lachnospiraceae bacterium]|nr:serine hydrolase domain-containing protein [Lachnospiraceae bacterium]
MKKYISLLLVILIVIANPIIVTASENPDTVPSGVNVTDLEKVINSYVEENESTTAAVSIAVFNHDKVLFKKAYGSMDIENGLANDETSVFEWGSCTKLLVWTSIMQLVEQGKIDVNEDIRTYLPKGFFKKLKYDAPITVINLMNHNAGWQETVTDLFIEDKADIKDLGDALRYIEPEQVFKPGETVAYSNWNSALGGYIVECVSGEKFDTYVHENIFKPLGMEHTAINADLSDNEWVREKRLKEKCYTAGRESLGTCSYYLSLYPAGGAVGTLDDFVKFAQAFVLNDGEKSALFHNRETLEEMLSPTSYFADGTTSRNCHGFWTDEMVVPLLWHNGGTVGSTSWFAFDPKLGTGTIILTNQGEESTYTCGILSKVFGRNTYTEDKENSKDISGVYVAARTCFKGYSKLYHLLCNIQLDPDGKGGYKVESNELSFTNAGKDSYELNMGDMKWYHVFVDDRKDGTVVLQMPGGDYIQVNGYGLIAECVLLLLFVIATVLSIITLLIRLIKYLRGNRKRPYMRFQMLVNGSVILSCLMFVRISLVLFSNSPLYRMVHWCLIVNAICGIIPLAYIVTLIIKWRKIECTRKQRIGLILTAVGGLVMVTNVIYWGGYIFW